MPPKRYQQPVREPRRLRSVRKAGGLNAGRGDELHKFGLASDAGQIIPMLKDKPTTLYIYPKMDDIDAAARAVAAGRSLSRAGLYWNVSCLKQLGSPKFWPKETLEPILTTIFKKDHQHHRRGQRRFAEDREICLCSLSLVRLFLVSWPLPRCLQLALSGGRSNFRKGVSGWTAPDGIDCARMRSLQISNKGDRPWNRLAELAWTRRNIFSSFMG